MYAGADWLTAYLSVRGPGMPSGITDNIQTGNNCFREAVENFPQTWKFLSGNKDACQYYNCCLLLN